MTIDLAQTTLVHKRACERLFCGCMFINSPEAIIHDCGWLRPEQFNDEKYRLFWSLLLEGKEKTEAAITAEIYSDLMGAQAEVMSCWDHTSYANLIAEDDRLLTFALKLPDMARAITDRDSITIDRIMGELNECKISGRNTIHTAVDVGVEFCNTISRKIETIDTGLTDFDIRTGGFEKKTLTLFAARPGMGKSAILSNIAEYNARIGKHVLLISLEMSERQWWARMACGYSNLTWQKVRKGELNPLDMKRLEEENTKLIEALDNRLLVDDSSRQTMDDIWKKVAVTKPDLVIIDHLSLLSDRGDSEIKRLGSISWSGKMIAKEFDCAVFFAQQLSRKTEGRENKRPILSDLRDSGELEQNADQVIFLYREDYYNGNVLNISPTELLIAKYRDGAVGSSKVMFNQARQRFYCQDTNK
jgi:replicative DNA helicase